MINVYGAKTTDFSTLGLAALEPTECTVEETAGGKFELTLVHPIDTALKWTYLQIGNVIKAPCATRQTPLVKITDNVPSGTITTKTRAIYRVKTSTGERLRLRAKPSLTAKVISSYKPGTQVVRLSVSGSWARVVVRKGGATGYMWADNLVFVKNETETVTGSDTVETVSKTIEPTQTREQLFRIYSVEPDVARNTVTVYASHIFYDLQGLIVTGDYSPENVPANTAVTAMLGALSADHDFNVYCTVDAPITGEYTGVSFVKALLDPDTGIVPQTGARIIRDNYDVFIVPDETFDRGMEIRHRKNMTGAIMTTDASSAVTRIRPVGKDKKGNRLLITDNGGWVESTNLNAYPTTRDAEVEYDVQVGSGDGQFKTEELAREELKKRAQQDFANGADLAKVSLEVEFVALENLKEYADYAPMLALYLYDTVRVIAAYAGINAKIRVNGYTYDCLLKRYETVQLGEITDIEQTTYGYEIADGSVSGSKVLPGSMDGNTIMRRASIGYAKIAQAAIDQLSTDAVTAIRADIHKIVSGEITTDQLYADLADLTVATITTAKIDWAEIENLNADIIKAVTARLEKVVAEEITADKLTASIVKAVSAHLDRVVAGNITTDELYAAIAEVTSLYVSTGKFDLATIKNLLSNALILKQGIADSMMITNLAVTSANLLNATIDKLVLKGADGKYYRVFIGSDGTIQTEEVTVTDGEVAAGETEEGRQIVATTANIGDLNATTIKASEAIIGTIFTESLTAGKITANDALIASLTAPIIYTTAIKALGDSLDLSANESIKLTVQGVRDDIDEVSNATETALGLAETAQDTASNARTEAANAQAAADEANENAAAIQTQLELTKNGLAIVQNETIPGLDGRVKTLESGVHISGAEIGIYTSESPYRNTITNSGWTISENGTAIIECAETKLTAPRVQVTDAFIVGGLAWKPGSDKHVRMLKYGR